MAKLIIGQNDLATVRPDLAKEWDFIKNGEFTPEQCSLSRRDKVWWKCEKGHSWDAYVYNRTKGVGCPYCSNQKVLPGYNDLATTHPNLAREYHPTKNDLKPTEVYAGSHKKVWWLLPYDDPITGKHFDFEWQDSLIHRRNGYNCPYLNGHKVWKGYNDLATVAPEKIKEWDYDKNGSLTPEDVTAGSGKIVWWKCEKGHEWKTPICSKFSCPFCSGIKAIPGENDIFSIFPSLEKEWDYDKNTISPQNIKLGSEKRVWWKCKKGHNWFVSPNMRIRKVSTGYKITQCPFCYGRNAITGENDLATINPELVQEWNYEKNKDLTPQDIMTCSGKKVWWICNKGHEYKTTIANRKNGRGCPYCSNKKVLIGYNDLLTTNPEIALEWDYEKNKKLTPKDVTCGSQKKVWWKCNRCGFNWETSVYNRSLNKNCPKCNLENVSSFCEQAVYYYVKQIFCDAINTDKHLGMELDIYIPSRNIAIEYDGEAWHNSQYKIQLDKKKNELCLANNIELIRIREPGLKMIDNCTVFVRDETNKKESLDIVIKQVINHISPENNLSIDCERDTPLILDQYASKKTENSLVAIYPDIAAEWHPTKNGNLTPDRINKGTGRKVWWLGRCGHEWNMAVCDRTKPIRKDKYGNITQKPRGCPICSRKQRFKKVKNIDTNQIFESVNDAAAFYNCNPSCITNCCKGQNETSMGYHWEYVD